MRTLDQTVIRAPMERAFQVASDVERWPEILSHYRWVRFIDRHQRGGTVEMAAWRPFGLFRYPTWWVSEMTLDRAAREIRYRHVRGTTTGMDVVWRLVGESDPVRPCRCTPDVPVADFSRRPVQGHLRDPPGGVAEQAEGAPSRHFHGATALVAVNKPDPPIVRQDFRPAFDIRSDLKRALHRRSNHRLIESAHHKRSVDRAVWQLHCELAPGDHAATILAPGRYRAAARTPASRSISSNSRFV